MAKRAGRAAGRLRPTMRSKQRAARLVEVSGVVDASGPSGGRSQGERRWTLDVGLTPWRVKGGELNESTLQVERPVTEKQLDRYMKSIKPYSVLKLRARLVEAATGRPTARVVRFLGPERGDAELRRHAKQLQKPVKQKDPQFGTLTFDRRMGWYSAKAKWNGRPVKVHLSAEGPEALAEPLKIARALWKAQAKWDRLVRKLAVKELLANRNEAWREEGEAPLTADQFLKRMKLESVTLERDGSFAFWHDDGDLFWGHSIQVSGNLKEGLTRVDTPG